MMTIFARNYGIEKKLIEYPVAIIGGGPVGLLLSRLLREYDVPHCLIEKRIQSRTHPQAHYLNIRTMEILRSCCSDIFIDSVHQSPPSTYWRDFVYCHSILGTEYARQNHFQDVDAIVWSKSPTTVLHLAQNAFESILRQRHHHSADGDPSDREKLTTSYFGYSGELSSCNRDHCVINLKANQSEEEILIRSKFLVSCEGTSSSIRRSLQIQYEGKEKLQHLINIHFKCPKIKQMMKSRRPAMLYFVFNQKTILVIVVHNILNDEYVCQLPYFPPYEAASDFNKTKVLELLTYALFGNNLKENEQSIDILDISNWMMNAQVSKQFIDPEHHRIFLVGDAAHRFPPSGGFGMNTGIQDAHNLAWKLAYLVNKETITSLPGLARSYEAERKHISWENTHFSLRNYENTANTATSLGVDPKYAEIAKDIGNHSITNQFLPFPLRKEIFLKTLQTGLFPLSLLENYSRNPYGKYRVESLQKLIATKKGLGLIFPTEDIEFTYPTMRKSQQEGNLTHQKWSSLIGQRLPHHWFLYSDPRKNDGNRRNAAFISTIDLPHMIWKIVKESPLSNQITVPPYLLLFSDALFPSAKKFLTHLSSTIAKETLVVVNLRSLSKNKDSIKKSELFDLFSIDEEEEGKNEASDDTPNKEHKITQSLLQKKLQIPHFNLQDSSQSIHHTKTEEILALSRKNSKNLQAIFETKAQSLFLLKGMACLDLFEVDDGDDAQKDESEKSLYLDLLVNHSISSVLIRPDGHIVNVYKASLLLAHNEDQFEENFAQTILNDLHFSLNG